MRFPLGLPSQSLVHLRWTCTENFHAHLPSTRTNYFLAVGAVLYSTLRGAGTALVGGPSRAVVFGSGLVAWFLGSSLEDPEKRLGILLWQAQYFFQALGGFLVSRGTLIILWPLVSGLLTSL